MIVVNTRPKNLSKKINETRAGHSGSYAPAGTVGCRRGPRFAFKSEPAAAARCLVRHLHASSCFSVPGVMMTCWCEMDCGKKLGALGALGVRLAAKSDRPSSQHDFLNLDFISSCGARGVEL